MKSYSRQVLQGSMRTYVIDKVKKPLMKAIITLVDRYPEPTRENCLHPNTHRLFGIRDRFFKYDTNKGREAVFRATFKLLIAEYEHDPYYRERFNWFLGEINKSDWQPTGYPISFWEE